MSANSSSTSNDPLVYYCSNSKASRYIFIGFYAVKTILILPLSTFILLMGYKQWWQQRSFNAASHSDLFTYHLAAMEMFLGFGLVCYLTGLDSNSFALIIVAFCSFSFTLYAEIFFHLLTCVERYLAVVHPITYRGLRNARGIRIRNISIGCVWLLSFVLLAPHMDSPGNDIINFTLVFLFFCILVISFCSFSVLCVLIRPGPREGGRDKVRVDKSKQRAFYTITAILAALWLWFIFGLATACVKNSPHVKENVTCLLMAGANFVNLPGCLVSPLLFLHRRRKLSCSCFKCG